MSQQYMFVVVPNVGGLCLTTRNFAESSYGISLVAALEKLLREAGLIGIAVYAHGIWASKKEEIEIKVGLDANSAPADFVEVLKKSVCEVVRRTFAATPLMFRPISVSVSFIHRSGMS